MKWITIIFFSGLFGYIIIGLIIMVIEEWKEQEEAFKDDPIYYPPHNIKAFLNYLKNLKK